MIWAMYNDYLRILPVYPADLLLTKELLDVVWASTYNALIPEKIIRIIHDKWHSETELMVQILDPDIIFLKVVTSQKPCAGMITLVPNNEVCLIGRLYLHPNIQGKGVGSQCMSLIESMAAPLNTLTVNVLKTNLSALSFYQKSGFRIIAEEDLWIHSHCLPQFILEKSW